MTTKLFRSAVIDSVKNLGPKRFDAIESSIAEKQPAVLTDSKIGNAVFSSCLLTLLDQISMIGPKRTSGEIQYAMEYFGMGKDTIDDNNKPTYSRNLMAGINSIVAHETKNGILDLTKIYSDTLV